MKPFPRKTLLQAAMLLSGLASLTAQATVAYGVRGSAQAEARDDGTSLNDNHRYFDPLGPNEMFWDYLSVQASTTASVQLGGRQAASISRAWGYRGSVGLSLASNAQITDSHYYAKSTASAEAILQLNSSITGAAGSSGVMVLTGETYYGFTGGPMADDIHGVPRGPGSGGYNLGWLAQAYVPGSGGCLVPGASCRASLQANRSFLAGASGGGLVPWRLELTVRAGDDFSFQFRAAGIASAGAGLTVDDAAPPGLRSAAAQDGTAAAGATRIWLSPGLALADTGGLVALGDGRYGFASPVPEPATWAVMLLGLAALGATARVRRCGPRAC